MRILKETEKITKKDIYTILKNEKVKKEKSVKLEIMESENSSFKAEVEANKNYKKLVNIVQESDYHTVLDTFNNEITIWIFNEHERYTIKDFKLSSDDNSEIPKIVSAAAEDFIKSIQK